LFWRKYARAKDEGCNLSSIKILYTYRLRKQMVVLTTVTYIDCRVKL
jgi:hypothetical protein